MSGRLTIDLALERMSCLIVGGGEVATRKLNLLLESGATSVRLISPHVSDRITTMAQAGAVQLESRPVQAGDCAGATLVFACTDDAAVNAAVVTEARRLGALAYRADESVAGGDFIMPMTVRSGPLLLTVSTGGASPTLARHIAAQLRQHYASPDGPAFGEAAEELGRLRAQLHARTDLTQQERSVLLRRAAERWIELLAKEQ